MYFTIKLYLDCNLNGLLTMITTPLQESGMALITAEDLDDAAEKAVKALSS